MPFLKTVIAICGPTASGKTALAVELAKKYNTGILSADSRQCYRELNIGVAKPSASELEAVPHYFINSHSVKDPVNAASFEQYGLEIADKVFAGNDFLILAGGTGLYVKAFLEGLDDIPPVREDIVLSVREDFKKNGPGWLKQRLTEEDPVFGQEGEMENPQRMMRALEVKRATGKSILSYYNKGKSVRNFNIKKIFLDLPRELLYKKIDLRVDTMMTAGLLTEAKLFYPYRHLNALQTVGYTELFDYMDDRITLETAVELIKRNTRHYAKRQMTWFKKYFVDQKTEVRDVSGL